MEKALFSFSHYSFSKAELNLKNLPKNATFSLHFSPVGQYDEKTGIFELTLSFKANVTNKKVVEIECNSIFTFKDPIKLEDIPSYFYPNSIAIVFPYIRSFVSTLTLQANVQPIVLPTMNLMGLQEELRKNTIKK